MNRCALVMLCSLAACEGSEGRALDAADTRADGATGGDTVQAGDTGDTVQPGEVGEPETDGSTSACPLAEHTTVIATSASGCALLTRDTGACRAEREAAGLSGVWLAFSCRVSLSRTTANGIEVVRAEADGQPDYPSFYFQSGDACYEAWPEGHANPNHIVATTRAIDFPVSPAPGPQAMGGGIVGIAVNGVPLFGNFAAPGDDIFLEAGTFDRCGAHPTENGTYHYHGEPLSISSDDARLIGVVRDGYPVYGRRDADGSIPTLDAQGGHTSVTAESPSEPVYHYHLNEQVSTAPGTAGDHQWFLTKGAYHGAPAACAACR